MHYGRMTTATKTFALGEEAGHLVSRSQANRLLSRLESFKTVILEFGGVPEIGPAFADEIFRVYAHSHPHVRVVPLNANENVNRMILRALTSNGEPTRNG